MQLLFVCLYLMFDEGAIMELFNSDVINTWVTETSKIISGAMSLSYCSSPWYNHTGWLGIKHQVTYYLMFFGCTSERGWSR